MYCIGPRGRSLAEAIRRDDGEPPERSFLRAKSESAPRRSMFSVEVLNRHPTRDPDYKAESLALVALAQEMAVSPDRILHKLVERRSSCAAPTLPD
jgi:hypothetical protein